MKLTNPLKLVIAIIFSELAGIIGSVFTAPSIATWYAGLIKPALNPPSWIFAPVWTTLFALMGIAAFLVWKKGLERKDVKIALIIFAVQLILNTLWSIIFFGFNNPGAAFIEIIFLWLAILATIISFKKISKPTVWLLLPYILWVSFAGYLNFSLWRLNANTPNQVGCTLETKICSDGSSVGRTEPNCEFAACPGVAGTELWNTYTDSQSGVSFKYPENLTTKYINTVDWPPLVQVLPGPYTCLEAGSENAPAGKTEKRLVDNREYCLTRESEGAAGSIYTQYAYAFAQADKVVYLTFSLRFPQCGNYSEPQLTACQIERETFDIDSVIDKIARTLKLN